MQTRTELSSPSVGFPVQSSSMILGQKKFRSAFKEVVEIRRRRVDQSNWCQTIHQTATRHFQTFPTRPKIVVVVEIYARPNVVDFSTIRIPPKRNENWLTVLGRNRIQLTVGVESIANFFSKMSSSKVTGPFVFSLGFGCKYYCYFDIHTRNQEGTRSLDRLVLGNLYILAGRGGRDRLCNVAPSQPVATHLGTLFLNQE